MKLYSIEFDKNKKQMYGLKNAVLWGRRDEKTNCYFPLLYLTKPKHMSKEDYDWLIERINIEVHKEPIRGEE